MRSKVRLARHPVHPMLVTFPIALLPILVLLDVGHFFLPEGPFYEVGFYVAVLGVLSTVAAMVPGFVDLAHIPDASRAHRTAVWHMTAGIVVLFVYVGSAAFRWPAGSEPGLFLAVLALDVLGLALVGVTGWLGGELVYRHHVGVMTQDEGGEPVVLTPTPGDARAHRAEQGSSRRRDVGPP